MVSSDISHSGDTGEYALSPVDSHCSTMPLGRPFAGVKKSSRERADSTERGIGPGNGNTIEVNTRDLEMVTGRPDDSLAVPYEKSSWKLITGVIAGAFLLVTGLVFAIARRTDDAQVAKSSVVEQAPALAAPVVAEQKPAAEPVSTPAPAAELVAAVHPLDELAPPAVEKPAPPAKKAALRKKGARPLVRAKVGAHAATGMKPATGAKASLGAKLSVGGKTKTSATAKKTR